MKYPVVIPKLWNLVLVVCAATSSMPANAQQPARLSNDMVQDSVPVATKSTQGYRTDGEIQSAFEENKGRIYRIYNQELKRNRTLRGKIVFRIVIQPSGSVSSCTVHSSTVGDKMLEQKIAEGIRTVNFGAKHAPVTTILYPIDFIPTLANEQKQPPA